MTSPLLCDIILGVVNDNIGMSPSGKALDFDSSIRQFKSGHPSQHKRHATACLLCWLGWLLGENDTPKREAFCGNVQIWLVTVCVCSFDVAGFDPAKRLKCLQIYGIMKKNKAKEHEWDGTLC